LKANTNGWTFKETTPFLAQFGDSQVLECGMLARSSVTSSGGGRINSGGSGTRNAGQEKQHSDRFHNCCVLPDYLRIKFAKLDFH
jgi:hypothetical protein